MKGRPTRPPDGAELGGSGWLGLWPVAALAAAFALAWAFGLFRYVSLDALAKYHESLGRLVAARPATAAALYLAAYAGAVAVSIPAGPVLTMAGGLLFGRWPGAALAVVAAMAGACALFLVVRSALAAAVARRTGALAERLRPGLERDGFWYLLSVRLLPLVPFPVGTIASALVGMPFPAFVGATALGIVPGTVLYASIGAGLGDVFARGERPDASAVLSPPVLLPLIGLAGLSLAAMWLRRRRSEA